MKKSLSRNGIIDITEGMIAHQVNCCGVIGAGVSGAIINRYPIVETAYMEECAKNSKTELFGTVSIVQVAVKPALYVANVFSQMYYGNSAKTGIVYTDMKVLTDCLKNILVQYDGDLYVPDHIGCGLAGGDWNNFLRIMKDTDICIRERTSV